MVQQVLLTAVLLVSAVQEIYSTATDPCSDSSQHSSCCCNGLSPNVFPDASSAYESSHAEGSRVSTRGRLPTFIIRTSDTVVDEPKIDATVCVCLPSGQPLSKLATRESNYNKGITSNNTWRLHYQGALSIEVRGSSSQRHDRKSYSFELKDDEWDDDKDFPLLGMPADDDWVLIGAETDKTLGMRNHAAYKISREALDDYASRTEWVEVFLLQGDGEQPDDVFNAPIQSTHYQGLYLLGESIRISEARVDIPKFKADDLSGGYIIKFDNDNIDEGDAVFPSSHDSGSQFVMVEPKMKDDGGDLALYWISYWINGLEQNLESLYREGDESDTIPQLDKCLDWDSFIDYMLLTEITKNPDGYRGSVYMHKNPGNCLKMGPAWDYNEAFGLCCGFPFEGYADGGGVGNSPKGWRFQICEVSPELCQFDPVDGISWWFQAAWKSLAFRKAASQRWEKLRLDKLTDEWVLDILTTAKTEIRASAGRTHARWSQLVFEKSSGTPLSQWDYFVADMGGWIIKRLTWMDEEFNALT